MTSPTTSSAPAQTSPAPQAAQQPSAPMTWGGGGGGDSRSVTHQHLADPTSQGNGGGRQSQSPYLLDHPGLPNKWPMVGEAPAPEAAAPPAKEEKVEPSPLEGTSRNMLAGVVAANLKAFNKRAAAEGWGRERGFSPNLDPNSPTGWQGIGEAKTPALDSLTNWMVDKKEHPRLAGGLQFLVNSTLKPMLGRKESPFSHMGNVSDPYMQRLATNHMFLQAGNNSGNPLMDAAKGIAGRFLNQG